LDSLIYTKGAVYFCVDSTADIVKSLKFVASHFEAKEIPDRIVKNLFYLLSDVTGIISGAKFGDANGILSVVADLMDRSIIYKPKA
jgi:hypothetical protein